MVEISAKQLALAPGLKLPIDIAGQTTAIFGIRGSGKTNTAGALVEELLDRHQPIAVIDPTDAWWGLRASRDGSPGGGYPVFIFGGSHGDIPLQETDGRVIAEFLVREQVSVVLSLRHLRKAAQRRFVTEFCEELYHLKGKDENRTPLTVVIDEAPLFVPQKVMGEVARTVGAVEDLIARGRNAGFGVVLISQRSATLNADVRTQADTMICHRLPAALDRKAIREWFEENASVDDLADILKSLATLKNGEGWVWSPALGIMSRVQMRLRRTFDSSATPRVGQVIRPPKQLADINLDKLKLKLAAALEQKAADDPKELRKRIAELERAATQAKPAAMDPAAIAEAERRGYQRAAEQTRSSFNSLLGLLDRFLKELPGAIPAELELNEGVLDELRDVFPPSRPPVPQRLETKPPARGLESRRAETARPVREKASAGDSSIGNSGLRRIMIALAQKNGLSPRQVGIRAGMAASGGSFRTYLSRARTQGWITGSAGRLEITQQGLSALGSYEPLPVGLELREYWLSELGDSGAARILRALCDAYPRSLDAEQIGRSSGMSPEGGSFRTYLSRLRTLELITGRGEMRASEDLF